MDTTAATLRQRVVDKAQRDSNFRKWLLSNPREAVKSEVGVDIPSAFEIEVLQETSRKIYLVLPPESVEGQLSDDQLESVSGGAIPAPMFT
jgi:hypothetical protein